MNKATAILAALSFSAILGVQPAQATTLENYTGLSGTHSTQTFDTNAGTGSAAANQFSGLTFSAGSYVNNDFTFTNVSGGAVGNFYPCCTQQITLTFDGVQDEAAFALVSNQSETTISAYLGTSLVESLTAVTTTDGMFYGFTDIAFDSISIRNAASGFLIDNLELRANDVPEPASLALVAAGLLGLTTLRRRQA